jgi:hypothetical protein
MRRLAKPGIASDFLEFTVIKVAIIVSRIGAHVAGTALASCSVALAGIAKKDWRWRCQYPRRP